MTTKQLKTFILSSFLILSSFFFWWKLSLFFNGANISRLITSIISIFIFYCFSIIFMIVVKNRNSFYITYIIISILFFLFFNGRGIELNIYIVSILLFLGFFVLGYEMIRKQEDERRHITYRRIWKAGLPFLITGLSLIVAVIYYFNPLFQIKHEKIEIPPSFFGSVMVPFKSVVRQIIPFYQPGMTIDEMIIASEGIKSPDLMANLSPETMDFLKKELDKKGFENLDTGELLQNPQFLKILQDKLKDNISEDVLEQKRQEIENSLNVEVEGDDNLDDLVSGIVNDKLSNFIGPYSQEVSILIAVAFFLLLKFIGTLLTVVIIIFSRLLMSILIALNFINIKEAKVSKEFLKL